MQNRHHIFIAGLHRSGTSLLHEILRSHPSVSGFTNTGVVQDEGQHLQSVFPAAKIFGGPGKFGFHPESYMDESHPLATPENSEKLLSEWGRNWDFDKLFLIEKSPPNLIRTRFLQHLFPTSTFIVILRHPVAVAIATQKWSRTSVLNLIHHTLRCYELFFNDAPHLKSVCVIRYEDFVSNPQENFDNVLAWAGLQPHIIQHEIRNENVKYMSLFSASGGKYSISNNLDEIARIEAQMNKYGYSLEDPMTNDNALSYLQFPIFQKNQ